MSSDNENVLIPPPPVNPIPNKIDWDSLTPLERTAAMEQEESVLHRKLMVFGTDVSEIPCFRNSFLYGITGGIGVGIATFALTSRVRRATSFGFWSYVAITSSYWCWCRYEYSTLKFEYAKLKYAMKKNVEAEGTENAMPRDFRS